MTEQQDLCALMKMLREVETMAGAAAATAEFCPGRLDVVRGLIDHAREAERAALVILERLQKPID